MNQYFKKPWYKEKWGIIIVFLFFPILVPYLVWTETNWNKWLKIAITMICILFIISNINNDKNQEKQKVNLESENKQKIATLIEETNKFIEEDKITEALSTLKKCQDLDKSKKENPAFDLEEKLKKLESEDFLKEILLNMSDEDSTLLSKDELKKSFIDNEKINNKFLKKLKSNLEKRSVYIEEKKADERKKEIEKQFSGWDGSHIKLTKIIKESMNDPDSYEHVETRYSDMKDYIIVITTFRGKNAFGGVVKNSVKAKISIDGNDIQIIE